MASEPEQALRELSELYCLGLADDDQVAEIESRLKRGDAALATEIDRLSPVTEALLGFAEPITPPPELRERISASLGLTGSNAGRPSAPTPEYPATTRLSPLRRRPMLMWAAVAASVLLAVWGWWPRLFRGGPQAAPLAGYRALAADPRTITWNVGATGEWASKGGVGTFLWNPALQRGFLRVTGVDVNNPIREQFQGWFFDSTRDKYAVSGGVFDISSSTPRDEAGNYIIEIRPDLPVGGLTMFGVTFERPGGVVVTDATRLVMAAKAKGGGS